MPAARFAPEIPPVASRCPKAARALDSSCKDRAIHCSGERRRTSSEKGTGSLVSGAILPQRVLLAVVAQEHLLAVTDGGQRDRALPHAHQGFQGLPRIVAAQGHAAVLVPQQELSAVFEVGVFDHDEGISEVGELKQKLLLDRLELARLDLEAIVAARPSVGEKTVLDRKLGGQKLVDEGHVRIQGPHFEELFSPEAEPKIPVLLHVQVVALLPLPTELPLVPALLDAAE